MPRLVPVLALALLTGPSLARGAAEEHPLESRYFPLKVGTVWTYKSDGKNVSVRVARYERVNNVVCGVLEANSPEGRTVTDVVGVTKDGVYRFEGQGMKLVPPLLLLPLPPKEGATFKVDSKASARVIKGTFTVSQEDVQVPAGKYKAFKTHCDELSVGPMKWSITYWFAPYVGMVKQQLQTEKFTLTLELTKYTPGK